MKQNMPVTPFSTWMTGGASLLRERIRGICTPGRRPTGRIALLAMLAVCLASVNLVACQSRLAPLDRYRSQVKSASSIRVDMPVYSDLAFPEPISEEDLLDRARSMLEQAEPAGDLSGEDFSQAALLSMRLALGESGTWRLSQGENVCWLAEGGENLLDPFEPIGVLPEEAMETMKQLAATQLSRRQGETVSENVAPSSEDPGEEDPAFRQLLLEYYRDILENRDVVWNDRQLLSVPEGTMALGPAEYLGSMNLNDGETECLYRLKMCEVQADGSTVAWEDNLVALARDPEGGFLRADGNKLPDLVEEPLEDTIRRTVWGISSLDMALFQDGSPEVLGCGKGVTGFEEQTVPLEESGPVYAEGDAWVRQTRPGLEITGYYAAATGKLVPYIMDVTGTEFATWRGIRVGDSRETVKQVYPEAQGLDGPTGRPDFWGIPAGDLEDADTLRVNVSGTEMAPENLLFLFEGDTLSRMIVHFTMD